VRLPWPLPAVEIAPGCGGCRNDARMRDDFLRIRAVSDAEENDNQIFSLWNAICISLALTSEVARVFVTAPLRFQKRLAVDGIVVHRGAIRSGCRGVVNCRMERN
jgi:hypothetical protein